MAKKKVVINERKGVGTRSKELIVLSLANEAYAIQDIAKIVDMSTSWVCTILRKNKISRSQERVQEFSGQQAMNEKMATGTGKEIKLIQQTTVECNGKAQTLATKTKRRVIDK